ncbi:hypothetical protein Tco_1384848 [Tanacetum coccineum]
MINPVPRYGPDNKAVDHADLRCARFHGTYTKVSSPFEDRHTGSLGVDGLPLMLEDPYVEAGLQASPSPDYVSGPEHPPLPVYVPYVPEPVYPEFMPLEDDVLLAEEQPLPAAVSPTIESPGYIADFDPEEDKEDPEEDLADYPADGRDDDDDDESSDDDEDDDDVEEDEGGGGGGGTPSFDRLCPTTCMSASLAMIRAAAPSTYILAPRSRILPSETPPSGTPPLLLIPLPTPLPPLILSSTDCRAGVSEVTLPPCKRLYIALGLRFKSKYYRFVGTLDDEIRRDPKREVGYGITNTWDEIVEDMHETPTMTDVAGLSQWMTDSRLDRRAHARTVRLMETEVRLSRKAWVQSMDASDTARYETQVIALQSQQGPASCLALLEIPEEADSSS